MLTLTFSLQKFTSRNCKTHRWKKTAVSLVKIWGRNQRTIDTQMLAGRKGILLSPEREALNPNHGEENEGILRLLKQLARSADYLSHSLFSLVCFRPQRDINWNSPNHFTRIPWENMIKNRKSFMDLRTFLSGSESGQPHVLSQT